MQTQSLLPVLLGLLLDMLLRPVIGLPDGPGSSAEGVDGVFLPAGPPFCALLASKTGYLNYFFHHVANF